MQEPSFDDVLKVLLVEDNPADARLVQALLAGVDEVALSWTPTLAAALEHVHERPVDLVLLDLLLPDAHGIDLIARFREVAPSAAILVASGQPADDQLLARAVIRKGADDLLAKGTLTTDRLTRSLFLAVERAQLRRAAEAREVALARALGDAHIGHWAWSAGSRTVRLAGHFPSLGDPTAAALPCPTRLAARHLLRRLPPWVRRSLHAAWRERGRGVQRVAVIVIEAGGAAGAVADDLVIEAEVERDPRGSVHRIEGIVRDAAGRAAVEVLEGELLTHLGHELRTPLTTIRGALGLVAGADEGRLAESVLRLVGNAITNAERIDRIIGESLGTGSEPAEGLCFQPRRVPLGAFLYDALAARLPSLTIAGITLDLAAGLRADDRPVDAGRLRRALDWLCRRLLTEHPGAVAGRPTLRRFVLAVEMHDGVVWLRAAPASSKVGDAAGRCAALWQDRPDNAAAQDGHAPGGIAAVMAA